MQLGGVVSEHRMLSSPVSQLHVTNCACQSQRCHDTSNKIPVCFETYLYRTLIHPFRNEIHQRIIQEIVPVLRSACEWATRTFGAA